MKISDKVAKRAWDAYKDERRNWSVTMPIMNRWLASRAREFHFDETQHETLNAAHEKVEIECWKAALSAVRS